MALIACRECGNEVSTEAKSCPKCGAKVVPTKPAKRPTKKLTWALLLAALILGGIAVQGIKSEHPAASVATKLTPEQTKKRDAQLQAGAVGAQALKRAAKDPQTFELTSLVVKDDGASCYEYRAKNSFGAILPGRAVLSAAGKLLIHEQNGNAFIDVWNKSCTKEGGDDVTEYVKKLGVI